MPGLDDSIITDLTNRVRAFTAGLYGYGQPEYLTCGGSAAVFKTDSPNGPRIIKAFNPALLTGIGQHAERRRMDLQRRLIGHSCPYLVQTYRVEEAQGTGIVEMEFVEWPSLQTVLADVPDQAVAGLVMQLVEAVKFLDQKSVVHRDIKPENIHVSADFQNLKLLDLGVTREFDVQGEEDVTDQGHLRPFLATAQYSSPEYLFRLDPPSTKLWQGLNFYQIGAVLHDLIMKKPIFQEEVRTGNRFLVGRAVLLKIPSFTDSDPERLHHLKALAARCLDKDLDSRLNLVGWDDFVLQGRSDPLATLKARLANGLTSGSQANASAVARLKFDRTELQQRMVDRIRTDLIPVCAPQLPINVRAGGPGDAAQMQVLVSVNGTFKIHCFVSFEWRGNLYERTANVKVAALIQLGGRDEATPAPESFVNICAVTITADEDEASRMLADTTGRVIARGLDLAESASNIDTLHGHVLTVEA